MIAVLWAARKAGISPVVILTHPHEFVKAAPPGRPGVRPNRINKDRLVALCNFLAAHPDEFAPVSFRQASLEWLSAGPLSSAGDLGADIAFAFYLVQNKTNDLVKWV